MSAMKTEWYYIKTICWFFDKKIGPLSTEEILQCIERGGLELDTHVLSPTMTKGKWVEVRRIPKMVESYNKHRASLTARRAKAEWLIIYEKTIQTQERLNKRERALRDRHALCVIDRKDLDGLEPPVLLTDRDLQHFKAKLTEWERNIEQQERLYARERDLRKREATLGAI